MDTTAVAARPCPHPRFPHVSPLPFPLLLRSLPADPFSPGGECTAGGRIITTTPTFIITIVVIHIIFVFRVSLVEHTPSPVVPPPGPFLLPLLRTDEDSTAPRLALLPIAPRRS